MDDHTPGEWTLDPSDGCIVLRVDDEFDESHANDRVIAEVLLPCDGPVVAAAPDLLAAAREALPAIVLALRLVVADVFAEEQFLRITQELRAAIAKAEGDAG